MYKQRVVFATGSRADYGIVRKYLSLLNNDSSINFSILVTGALLSSEFGHQVDLVYRDGFQIEAEIDIPINPSSNLGVVHSMSVALDKFGYYFSNNKVDLLIILGDRYEMLSVATAAAMNRIPILHLHGGEATYGNYDEFIRHSITKMSLFHFTSTEEFRNRVIQLGEDPERVYNLGALGAENCLHIDEAMVPNSIKQFQREKYFVILFHPETLTNVSVLDQVDELLSAINRHNDFKYIFLGSNADTHSDLIRNKIKCYVASNDNCLYYENLPTAGYHFLLKHSSGLIGNSSSGLIEAPSLNIWTINIGDRQEGRVRGNSILDVRCNATEISNAIDDVIKKSSTVVIENPYYKKNAASNYYAATLGILKDLKEGLYNHPKSFFNLSNLSK